MKKLIIVIIAVVILGLLFYEICDVYKMLLSNG